MKEVMVHIYRKIKQISSPFFRSCCLVTFKKSRGHLPLVTLGITKMAVHSFPVSLGLPRWRPYQIPDPGEGTLSQFPAGSPPPPPPTLGLNIDRCISLSHIHFSSRTSAKHSRHLRSPITDRLRIFVKRNPSRLFRFARSVRLLIGCARSL